MSGIFIDRSRTIGGMKWEISLVDDFDSDGGQKGNRCSEANATRAIMQGMINESNYKIEELFL